MSSVVDMSAIASALGALKGMKDIAQAMIGLHDAQALQEKRLEFQDRIIDAQNGILTAQEERTTLLKRVDDLEKEVAGFETWEAEKQRYELTDAGGGVVAYAPKNMVEGSTPTHRLCANCFERREKAYLQPTHFAVGRSDALVCNACGAINYIRGFAHAEHAPVLAKLRR
jgi:hypothetical protein